MNSIHLERVCVASTFLSSTAGNSKSNPIRDTVAVWEKRATQVSQIQY